jgi:hypothetical protein
LKILGNAPNQVIRKLDPNLALFSRNEPNRK